MLSLALAALLPIATRGWVSQANDWLVSTSTPQASTVTSNGSVLTLTNGLITRSFVTSPCFATIEYKREDTQTVFLRGLSPEASLSLNGIAANVGGCLNHDPHANSQWFDYGSSSLAADPSAFTYSTYRTSTPDEPFPWTPGTWHSPTNIPWPPNGVKLSIDFSVPQFGPNINGTNLTTLDGYEFPCGSSGCLTGWSTCDNSSVAGQCSWPAATAAQECAAWPECAGVNCNLGRSDCQARGLPFTFQPSSGFNTVYKSGSYPAAGATVTVNYEMYDGIPVIRKWLSVTAGSGPGSVQSVLVNNVTTEILRAPNFAPDMMTVFQVQPNNPTPSTQQVVPELDQSFPGRTQQFWFFDPQWDACCDAELHVTYTYYTLLKVGYGFDVSFGGDTGPGALVTVASPWVGESSRFMLHDTSDWDRQGVGIRKMQSVIAPQLTESPIEWMITDISTTEAFQTSLTQASQAGFEMVIIGYGANGYCGMCPGQLQNASWVAWFKSNVQFGAALQPPVKVSAYTLMQMNGWGEGVPAAEQVLQRDGSRGGIACMATDFHAAYRQSILDFATEVGLAGVETDGQYENAACADDTGDHHHNGLGGSYDAQLANIQAFNAKMKAQGIYQTGADAYWMSGVNRWNHADTDAGYNLNNFWDKLTIGRDYVFDSSTTRLHTSGGYGIGDPQNNAKQCDPFPGRLRCVDYALASFYGQGVVPNAVSSMLWDEQNDPEWSAIRDIYTNWTSFFTAHRPILTSVQVVHLKKPSMRGYEATVFLSPSATATERAFVSVFNPTNTTITASLMAPLYYANIRPLTTVSIWQVSMPYSGGGSNANVFLRNATVGDDGGSIYDVSVPLALPPASYAFFTVTLPAA